MWVGVLLGAQVDLTFRLHTQPLAPVTLSFEAALPGGYSIIAFPEDAQLAAFLEESSANPSSFISNSADFVQSAPAQLRYTTATWSTFSTLSVAAFSANFSSDLVTISAVAASTDPFYDGLSFQFTVFARSVMTGVTVAGTVTDPSVLTEVRA